MNSLAFGKNSYSRTRNAHVAPDAHIRNSKVGKFCPARLGIASTFTQRRNGLGAFLRAFLSTVEFGLGRTGMDARAYIKNCTKGRISLGLAGVLLEYCRERWRATKVTVATADLSIARIQRGASTPSQERERFFMSVSGISSANLFDLLDSANATSQKQQLQQEIQQLGKDLSAGNLSAAQSDFATLEKNLPQATSSSQSSNPIAQAFQQLAKDLQSGDLSAAQQDFSTIQQDVQSQGGGHHHHGHGGSSSGAPQNPVAELFSELGQALQSGNLSAAQQAYTTLQQDFQQSAASGGSASNTSPAAGGVRTVA